MKKKLLSVLLVILPASSIAGILNAGSHVHTTSLSPPELPPASEPESPPLPEPLSSEPPPPPHAASENAIAFSQFAEGKLSYSTVDGKNYGVPFDNGAVVSCYRTDILYTHSADRYQQGSEFRPR